jgi:hypothetical protein
VIDGLAHEQPGEAFPQGPDEQALFWMKRIEADGFVG